jgi:cytochrome c
MYVIGALLMAMILCTSCRDDGPRVLVFSKTEGWVHTSIPYATRAIENLGKENGYLVDVSKDASIFNDKDLKWYDAVIFNNTTGNILNAEQQASFERYIQAGGGYVGIHSAADTEYEWPWYGKLMGAYFASHPRNPNVREATIRVSDSSHAATRGLPAQWKRKDEWYNYRYYYPDLKILATLDEQTYDGGTNGSFHPIAWYHEFDGGRAFYTGGGHEDNSFSDPLFLQHLQGGISYSMGNGRQLDYSRATAVAAPEENRFEKTVLINDLNTPMEMAVADDGRVFYTELRTANLGVYDPRTGTQSVVHRFDVETRGGTGLIGVTLDPDFAENNYIYLYYSPPIEGEPIIFHLTRFKVRDDNTLDLASAEVILQVPVEENSGAHHGGSLAWDANGNLFISTGDSSSPFPADGYAPLDERPGAEYYSLDAQRSAGNTNDLKGKILRIHPEYGIADGEPPYTIPKGNLFPPGTENTRPEIYAMGCRNPYRIAVNQETGTVYWGDIGPDAGEAGPQGPRGYDEFNQAKRAGNFGWPYFIGDNQAYMDWDFENHTAGPAFDHGSPVNDSPNNTGLRELPPAQLPMIWYPYAASEVFPELGVGGRSAMAGAFYSYPETSVSENRFPAYYDGTLFVFEWMRNWVMALHFNEEENLLKSEPFMSAQGDFRRPIDLAFGKDGIMYMLEYGSVYGADNEDARLVKIEYNRGNRSPVARASISDSLALAEESERVFITSERRTNHLKREISGEAPLRVSFSSRGTEDLDDGDVLSFTWYLEGKEVTTDHENPVHTYKSPGIYEAVLQVSDQEGSKSTDTLLVKVGNAPPVVEFSSPHNKSFFWEGKPFEYTLEVEDAEDGAISMEKTEVQLAYDPSPSMLLQNNGEHGPIVKPPPLGYTLMERSDCKACHVVEGKSVGPSYAQISKRYKGQENAMQFLSQKIIHGGGGNWGESVMSAHPQLAPQDVEEMVKYILALSEEQKEMEQLQNTGTISFTQHREDEPRGVYTLVGSYTDKGANGLAPLTRHDVLKFRKARVPAVFMDRYENFERFGNSLTNADHKAYYMLENVDLNGISGFMFDYSSKEHSGFIEVRIDSRAGPVILKLPYEATGDWNKVESLEAPLTSDAKGRHDIYFIMVKPEAPNEDIINLKAVTFLQ